MADYVNPHSLPPIVCAANIPTWTDDPVVANTDKMRKVHVDELRAEINIELVRRGLAEDVFTDSVITANATKIRKIHIDEIRSACEKAQIGDCVEGLYCPEDTVGALSWTNTITANATKPKSVDATEIRTAINDLMTSCICETEQCEYCADCGYHYSTCSLAGCSCDNHKYAECQHTTNNYWVCASINLASETEHPYKSSPSTPWDGTVPWDMCSYTPPGSNWRSCEYQGGHDHTAWGCKCNPYTW